MPSRMQRGRSVSGSKVRVQNARRGAGSCLLGMLSVSRGVADRPTSRRDGSCDTEQRRLELARERHRPERDIHRRPRHGHRFESHALGGNADRARLWSGGISPERTDRRTNARSARRQRALGGSHSHVPGAWRARGGCVRCEDAQYLTRRCLDDRSSGRHQQVAFGAGSIVRTRRRAAPGEARQRPAREDRRPSEVRRSPFP